MIKLNAFASHIDTDELMITPILVNPDFIKIVTPFYEPDEEGEVVDINKEPFGSIVTLDDEDSMRIKESVEQVYQIIEEKNNPLGL